jgi:transcriptional regulator with XRE-family HTH domain
VALSESFIRRIKPGPKQRKYSDSGGLHLLVTPSGGRLWRLQYRFGGHQKMLAFGAYPDVSLSAARTQRDTAKQLLAQGTDPAIGARMRKYAGKKAVSAHEHDVDSTPFGEKLGLILKMLSMSGAQLASELKIDKSVVSRWLRGSAQPSVHNLSRLSLAIAGRVPGFRTIDWERSPENIAAMFGAGPEAMTAAAAQGKSGALPIAIWDLMVTTTALRGKAYEGFFRSTRVHPAVPNCFIHDHGMIRRDDIGILKLTMGSSGTVVDGWMFPLQSQLICIAADMTGGNMLFGIFNGIGGERVDVFDGITLIPGFDIARSPTAMVMVCERIGDLSGDREADDKRIAELVSQNPVAPEGSVPEHIQKHLLGDFGPKAFADGGDRLLTLPVIRSMTRGPAIYPPDYWRK